MELTPALARELASLTTALDSPNTDIAASVTRLVTDVRAAIDSFLGITLMASNTDRPFAFTILDNHNDAQSVATSLMLTLSSADGPQPTSPTLSIVLYAGVRGAFVDLAADLEWMTMRTPGVVILDAHLDPIPTSQRSTSLINQAIGLLIGRGYPPDAADRELDARASAAGTDRAGAAELLLAGVNRPDQLPTTPNPRSADSGPDPL